jgi:hypothetical protein
MTTDKDRKRRIRARMEKTGESYTAARSQVLRTRPRPIPKNYEELAGMRDDAVAAKTGKTWKQWVRALDDIGAMEMKHRDVARWVHDQTGLDWWSQMVTVGYERIRGLRQKGQRLAGTFNATKSRTLPVSAAEVFHAFADEKLRRRWLDVDLVVRKATAPKSVRITWADGSNVEVWITAKGASRAVVAIEHGKLASRTAAADTKAFWTERLEALAGLLAVSAPRPTEGR